MSRELLVDDFIFRGQTAPPATGAPDGTPWRKAITGAHPTVLGAAGGMALSLTNDNEAQNACLYHGDVLCYPAGKLVRADIWASINATLDADSKACFGLGTARNNAPHSMAEYILFEMIANNEVLISTFDGVLTQAGIDTGIALGSTPTRFTIDLGTQIKSVPGGQSYGGLGLFSIESQQGGSFVSRRVCNQTQFDVHNFAGSWQPIVQIQKTAEAAGAAVLTIQRIKLTYKQE